MRELIMKGLMICACMREDGRRAGLEGIPSSTDPFFPKALYLKDDLMMVQASVHVYLCVYSPITHSLPLFSIPIICIACVLCCFPLNANLITTTLFHHLHPALSPRRWVNEKKREDD